MEDPYLKMKELLENENYPLPYLFKFVILSNFEDENKIKSFFSQTSIIKTNPSKNNKYVSISILETMDSSHSIIERYKEVSINIQNVIII